MPPTAPVYGSVRSEMKVAGKIQAFIGPMYSGKTRQLIETAERHGRRRRSVVFVKYVEDTRYDALFVATHQQQLGRTGRTVLAAKLDDVREHLFDPDTQVVAIDEGQFYSDLASTCEELANQGKIVLVAALDGDFMRRPFEQVSQLMSLVDKVEKLFAVCELCGRKAPFTFRRTGDTKIEVIGGADTYMALCRRCHIAETEKRRDQKQQQQQQQRSAPSI